jgi:hypothetical protein
MTYRHRFVDGKVLSQVENEEPQTHPLQFCAAKGNTTNRVGFADVDSCSAPVRPHLEGIYNKQKNRRVTQRGNCDEERNEIAATLLSLS